MHPYLLVIPMQSTRGSISFSLANPRWNPTEMGRNNCVTFFHATKRNSSAPENNVARLSPFPIWNISAEIFEQNLGVKSHNFTLTSNGTSPAHSAVTAPPSTVATKGSPRFLWARKAGKKPSWPPRLETRPYFPLNRWLFNRDPYYGLLQNPHRSV